MNALKEASSAGDNDRIEVSRTGDIRAYDNESDWYNSHLISRSLRKVINTIKRFDLSNTFRTLYMTFHHITHLFSQP